ncbi:nucleoside-diphosphate-sugar epimerase [Flavobacterium sp. CG_9.10]|uniref:SDR family oxidoreductase n=1 Tax=Flavobacterium sp. CG_9.10 TaxID=2787729 RepID=UPI0018CB8512|nr:SDR family oxidoreductase [Flavobacterium sp. CG_9.10]MBG6109216.1 nucleoside-diphosphate-sugar epimerase [Flavobacterium sp. CG_9.10]
MTKISILGCGWLGLPLAKALLEKGFSVNGSTTSSEKLSTLENAGISPFLISLHSKSVSGSIETFLQESNTLIIDIPPKLRGINSESFIEKIATLVPFIEKSSVKNVLFISSTSVYGEENDIVTEETPLNPDTESGKQLIEAEHLLQSNSNFKTTVIRFGGLIGEDRHPVKFLAGRENLDNPEGPINLIHQEDCIGIILKIIETDCWNETCNAVAPFHPSRENYYTQKAVNLNLALPKFNHENASIGKTILSDKIEAILNYTFTKPNL